MQAGVKAIILTLLAAAAVYLAGNARVQLWDRDEPRYAQCSRQMLQSGDWVVPRLYDKLRFQKPPLIYWCQASAMKLFGSEVEAGTFSARLPSAVAMFLTLVVLAIVIGTHVGAEQAAWTVFVMATSVLTLVAAKTCLTDSVLLLFTVIAQCCLYAIWRGNRSWSVVIIMAVALGLGGLTKGVNFATVACTAGALGLFYVVGRVLEKKPARRRGFEVVVPGAIDVPGIGPSKFHANSASTASGRNREIASSDPASSSGTGDAVVEDAGSPLAISRFHQTTGTQMAVRISFGLLIIAAIIGPWLYLVQHRAPEFLSRTMAEAAAHAGHGKEGHTFPPGYYLLLVWPMFMPWSLLLPMAIGIGIRNRKVPQVRFALAAVLGPWLMVEFIGTKLPHYLLPAYPALAYLVAYAILDCLRAIRNAPEIHNTGGPPVPRKAPHDLASTPFLIGAGIWALAIACVGALPWLAAGSFRIGRLHIGSSFGSIPWTAMAALTILAIIFGVGVFVMLYRQKFATAFVAMGIGMLATFGVGWTWYFPQADFLRISTHVAGVLQRVGATRPGEVAMLDYKEPSLAFYQGGTIREMEMTADLHRWPHWVVTTRDIWNTLSPEARRRLKIIDSYRGLAYSDRGRDVEVLVVENPVY